MHPVHAGRVRAAELGSSCTAGGAEHSWNPFQLRSTWPLQGVPAACWCCSAHQGLGSSQATPQTGEWQSCSAAQVRREHEAQAMRLLSIMRQVDLCESRTAACLGLWDASAHQAGREVSDTLDSVDKRLAPRAPRTTYGVVLWILLRCTAGDALTICPSPGRQSLAVMRCAAIEIAHPGLHPPLPCSGLGRWWLLSL